MEFLEEPKNKSGSWKIMLGALAVAVLVVAGIFWIISLKPSATEVETQALQGIIREDMPEFQQYGRNINIEDANTKTKSTKFVPYGKLVILSTDNNRLMKSPTAMGNTMISIGGKVKNVTGKTITSLEINVAITDMSNKPIKDKTVLIVPKLFAKLEDGTETPITVTIEGLDKDASPEYYNFRWKVTAIKVE
jgi:hypothetical protein